MPENGLIMVFHLFIIGVIFFLMWADQMSYWTFMFKSDFGDWWLGLLAIQGICVLPALWLCILPSSECVLMSHSFAGHHRLSIWCLQWQSDFSELWHCGGVQSSIYGTTTVGDIKTGCKRDFVVVHFAAHCARKHVRHFGQCRRTTRQRLHLYTGFYRMHRMLMMLIGMKRINQIRLGGEDRMLPVAGHCWLTGPVIVNGSIRVLMLQQGPWFQNWMQCIYMRLKVLKCKGSIFAYPNAKDIRKIDTFLWGVMMEGIGTLRIVYITCAKQNWVRLIRHGGRLWRSLWENRIALKWQNAHFMCQVKRCILCFPLWYKTAFL